MSEVVHLVGAYRSWCGESGSRVGDDQLDSVTCETCLGMAATFGGAVLNRLKQIRPTTTESPAMLGDEGHRILDEMHERGAYDLRTDSKVDLVDRCEARMREIFDEILRMEVQR